MADRTLAREARFGAAAARAASDAEAYAPAHRDAATPAGPFAWRSRPVATRRSAGAASEDAWRILIAAEPDLLDELIVSRFRAAGHVMVTVTSGSAVLAALDDDQFDLVILDAVLSGLPGFEICWDIRERSDIPVIFLTASGSLPERLLGFDAGADDYIVGPISSSELERRIRAVVRRHQLPRRVDEELEGPGGLAVRVHAHEVHVKGRPVQLTPKEFDMLSLLLRRRGEVLSPDELSLQIWGYETFGSPNFVAAHVSRLRRKLKSAGAARMIDTVRGVGYGIR